MSVFSAIEGSLKIQGTVSGTDATVVRLDEPSHALKIYLQNPPNTTVIVGDVTPNTLVGTDGITIISGSNFTTIQGFSPEFVAASGFLQSQIVGAGVTSLNNAGGAVLVTGTQNVTTQTAGQTITITGPDLSSFATTSLVTTTSGFLQTQIDAVEGSDVDSINSATGSISIVGEGATSISTAGSTISVITSPADALVGAGGITIVSGTNTTVISSMIAEALVGADGITVTSGSNTTTLAGFRGEFVAASGSLQSQISAIVSDEVEPAITGSDGITIISGSNTTAVQGFRSEFVSASGSLQTQITTNTNNIANLDSTYATDAELTTVSGFLQSEIDAIVVDEIEPAITGTDGIVITSGTNTTNVAGFRTEFVSASGSLQSQISSIVADEVEPAIVGTDGITIVSGSNTITVQGFRAEFVAASGSLQSQITTNANDIANLDATYATDAHLVSVSGFLQTQIDATEGSDVDSVNSIIGNVLITGTQNVTTQTVGQSITITGPDLTTYSTTAYVDNLVTTTSGHLQTQIDAVESSDVDSINGATGAITIEGQGITSVSTAGSTISIATPPANAIIGAGGISIVSGTNTTSVNGPNVRAVLSDSALLVVTTGTNTITLSPDTTPSFTSVDADTGTFSTSLTLSGLPVVTGFIQSGAGAVSRTVQSKERDVLTIADYGATGVTGEDGGAAYVLEMATTPSGRESRLAIGQYRFDATKMVVGPVNLIGEGCGAGPGAVLSDHCSQIYANFSSGDILYFGPTLYGSRLENFQINSGVGQRTSGAGIKISSTGLSSTGANYRLNNLAFNNQYDDIVLEQLHIGTIENTYHQAWKNSAISATNDGVHEGAGGAWTKNFFFGDTTASTTQPYIIDTRNGYTRISDNLLLGAQVACRIIANAGNPVGGFEVIHNWVEENDIIGIQVLNTGGAAMSMLRINNNEFSVATLGGSARTNFQSHITINAGSAGAYLTDVQINDNIMRSTASGGSGNSFISANSGSNMQICRNILEGLDANNTVKGIVVGAEATKVDVLDNIIIGTFNAKYSLTASCNFRDFGSNLTVAELPICRNGSTAWVSDGTANSNPIVSGGTGCVVIREDGAWKALRQPVAKAIISDSALLVVTSGSNTITLSPDTTPSFTSVDAGTGIFSTSLTISGLPVSVGAGTPGGSDTQVQFNDSGSFGGGAGLTYNKNTDTLTTVTITGTTGQFGGTVSSQSVSAATGTILALGGTTANFTTVQGTTVTGTNVQVAETLSAQTGNFSNSLTVSGVPVNTTGMIIGNISHTVLTGGDYTVACGNTSDYFDIITGFDALPFPGTADGTKEYLVSVHLALALQPAGGFTSADVIYLLLGSPPALTAHTGWAGGTTVSHFSYVSVFDLGVTWELFSYNVSQFKLTPSTGQTLSVGYLANTTNSKTGTGVDRVITGAGRSFLTIQRIS